MEPRRMDADGGGGRAVHRERRTRKLAVVVAVQNVLVIACLVVTLYVCWDVKTQAPRAEQSSAYIDNTVHIRLDPVSGFSGIQTVTFKEITSIKNMSLAETKDKIYVSCTGPYVLYMYVCYKDTNEKGANGTLELQVEGEEAPVSSFLLKASLEVCRGLQSMVYLRDKNVLRLHLNSFGGLKLNEVTFALSYMLGSQCQLF